ncbi:MAG: hypothetical protein HFI05_00280 [Lachnospiraceae bacterium]|jgi:hypothetical protein|nr:hypothetical protein [Lachnospiraceae bacterium]
MTLKEYIKEYYPIKEKLQIIKSDPIKMIMEQDDLPYDSIVSVDGKLQKVVYISEEDFIPVLEILSYSKEEVEKSKDIEFKEVWKTYMDNVEITDLNLENLMTISKEYIESRKRKEALLEQCIH